MSQARVSDMGEAHGLVNNKASFGSCAGDGADMLGLQPEMLSTVRVPWRLGPQKALVISHMAKHRPHATRPMERLETRGLANLITCDSKQ